MNTGTIAATQPARGADGGAVFFNNASDVMNLVNYGQIQSPTLAIHSDATVADTVVNFGTINGDVILSSVAASTVWNHGTINGDVLCG